MPLKIGEAFPADLKSLVEAQYDAFHPMDLMHVLVYPSPVPPTLETYQRTISRHQKTFADPNIHWIKIFDDQTGNIGNAPEPFLLLTPVFSVV